MGVEVMQPVLVVHFRLGEDVSRSLPLSISEAIELLDRYHERYPFEVFYMASIENRLMALPIKLGGSLNT